MSRILRILFVEDSEQDVILLIRVLRQGGYEINFNRVDTAKDMRSALNRQSWDLILSDYNMPGFDGLEALHILQDAGQDIPFILVSGAIGEERAAELMRSGARDFVFKGNWPRLIPVIERELVEAEGRARRRKTAEEAAYLARQLSEVQALAHFGYFEFNLDTDEVRLSDEIYRILGVSPHGSILSFDQFVTILPIENLDIHQAEIQALIGQLKFEFEYHFNLTDGTSRWVWACGQRENDSEGNPLRLWGILQDITERKKVEETLRTSETLLSRSQALLNAIVDSTSDMIWSVEPENFCLLTFNNSLKDYFWQRRGIQIHPGMSQADLFESEEYLNLWRGFYQRALAEGAFTTEYKVSAGSNVLQLTFNLLKRDGKVFGISVFGKDVSERKNVLVELGQSREQLRALSQYLQTAIEEERSQIAREIHDEFGQALTALKMDLAVLSRHLKPDQAAEEERIQSMTRLVDDSIRTVRRVATELRPGMLDDLGLPAALEWQIQEFSRHTGIPANLEIGDGPFDLTRDVATALFRIFQESLTNIARHAHASQVVVKLKNTAGEAVLTIQDNGRGIIPEEVTNLQSFGIMGMRERALAVNGEFSVKKAPRKGTIVRVSVQNAKVLPSEGELAGLG